jgi:thiamine biosynthesis lipoprotein
MKKELFGKEIEVLLPEVEEKVAEEIIDEMYLEALRLQKIFNIYDKDSELSKLNKKRKLKVSEELLEVLVYALKFCKLTNGKYDISIGKNILQRKNKEKEIKQSCSYKDIEIDGNEVILKNAEVLIDLGSVAKGYITDKLVEFLKSRGVEGGMLDSRGDIAVFGETKTKIAIQHPRKKEESICTIELKNCGVATSGDYYQFYRDFKKSHILNQKEIISLTVVAPTLKEADIYATVLFVLDKKEREELIKKNKNIKVFTVDESLNIKKYNGFEELLCN